MIRVAVVNYLWDKNLFSEEELLRRYFLLTGCAQGLRHAGAEVNVFQRFSKDGETSRDGVRYRFIRDRNHREEDHPIPRRLHQSVIEFCKTQADHETVVHINGLIFPLVTRFLRRGLPRKTAVVLQHHGEGIWARPGRWLQAWGLKAADAFFFAAEDLAHAWLQTRIISSPQQIYPIMEGSSLLRPSSRSQAAKKTGMSGNPTLFWAGNLDRNKDPLTILRGFRLFLEQKPEARLYMAYRNDGLLAEVRQMLNQCPRLAHAVTLLGFIAYSRMGDFYNSADIFLQGSRREGSGIAPLDALACGVVPVLTRIPSFQVLTQDGGLGALWPVGDEKALAEALLQVCRQGLGTLSRRGREVFIRNWSFAAIGAQTLDAYRRILHDKNGAGAGP